jgi:hypothetical protein
MTPEKIPPSRCPLGEAAKMLRFVSLARHHCYLDAAISGIGCMVQGERQRKRFFPAVQRIAAGRGPNAGSACGETAEKSRKVGPKT